MAATHLVESSVVLHRLAPGLRVVARGRDRLQVGMYAERRLVLPRTPDVERVLQALVELQPLDTASDPAAAEVLAQLDRAGVLLSGRSSTAPPASPVAVVGCLPGVDGPGVLVQAGLTLVTNLEQAATVVVLSPGELARELLDPLLRRGIEHVVVRLVDGGALVGPYVAPGLTACLRCIDAHLACHDPAHVEVLNRYVRATARLRSDDVPESADPLLAPIAATWAAREVRARLAGLTPATWSATLHLDADPARTRVRSWLRHPRCGCVWNTPEVSSGTMDP